MIKNQRVHIIGIVVPNVEKTRKIQYLNIDKHNYTICECCISLQSVLETSSVAVHVRTSIDHR